MMRRVAVTGIGVIAAPGVGRDAFWSGVSSGASAIRPMQLVPPGCVRFVNSAEVADYRPTAYFAEKQADLMDRCTQFAVIAAREAVADAQIEFSPALLEKTGVIVGCSGGGLTSIDEAYYRLYAEKNPRMHPLSIPKTMISAATSAIAMEYGFSGPSYTFSTACSAANHAIGHAYWAVRNGQVELAVTGGCEAPITRAFMIAWDSLRVVSPDTCRPFSRDRRGLIFGEGAAMLVLEPMESAMARGVHIWGEVAGFGMSSDAHHITAPLVAGAARAMRAAVCEAGVPPEAFGYVNAHGTGTSANDSVEIAAIHDVFGKHAGNMLISSTKAIHGHALGAAGALEAASTLMALDEGIIPPTANFLGPDPTCDLDVVPNIARNTRVEWALSNSFAFGGLNAVLAFRSRESI